MIPNEFSTMVKGCSACTKDHEISFKRMSEPTVIEGETFGYSGICGNTNTEVFLRHDHNKETKVV